MAKTAYKRKAQESQAQEPEAIYTSNRVNPTTIQSLTFACKVLSYSRPLDEHELRPSLLQLLGSIHLLNVEGRPCSLQALKEVYGYDYTRCVMRLRELMTLGYIERVKQSTTQPQVNLRMGYYAYSLSRQGVRYLVSLFELE